MGARRDGAPPFFIYADGLRAVAGSLHPKLGVFFRSV